MSLKAGINDVMLSYFKNRNA